MRSELLALLLSSLLAACSPETVVLVQLTVPPTMEAEASELTIRVFDSDSNEVYARTRPDADHPDALSLPATLPVVPLPGREGLPWRIEATLRDASGAVLGEQRAVVEAVPGTRTEVWLCFSDACRDVRCAEGERCEAGSCVDAVREPRPPGEVSAASACPAADCDCPCESDRCVEGVCSPWTRITEVSAGRAHTCAIDSAGQLFCWGSNASGQLGVGDLDFRDSPTAVAGLGAAAFAVGAGEEHTCAVREDGQLFCFGLGDDARLGNVLDGPQPTPVRVGGESDWTSVASGGGHSCGIRAGNQLFCFGDNANGQLGVGTTDPVTGPAAVRGDWLAISLGSIHTCGVRDDQVAYCWGWASYGRLGDGISPDGGTQNRREPVPSPFRTFNGARYLELSLGAEHTCGIESGSSLRCWGRGTDQRNGVGWNTPWPADPCEDGEPCRTEDFRWLKVATGTNHTCAIRDDGGLYCFGSHAGGALGLGDDLTLRLSEPTRVRGARWTALSAGRDTTCAIDAEGRLHCWGRNEIGQLGVGDRRDRTEPALTCFPRP